MMKHRHRPANIDSLKFVNEIRKFPALYDPSDSEYRNMEHKNAAWRAIAALIQIPVGDCQLRWKSLRDRFVREKRAYQKYPNNRVIWPLYNQLSFLTNYISHKTNRKNENSDIDLSDEGDTSQLDTSKNEDEDSVDIQDIVYNTLEDERSGGNRNASELGVRVGDISIGPVSNLPHTNKLLVAVNNRAPHRKRSYDEAKIQELLSKLVEKSEPDEDELFFMSAAKMIKRVPNVKRTALKMKIMQMISDEELT